MNIDSSRNSNNFTLCTVASKYFSGTTGMDESLSEFQEKIKSNTGPKTSEKPSGSKNKSRKGIKRIRGQKDIRTALKSKKNELISYANDFDKICKQSGINVDPEQLQLAIAISKSLHQTASEPEDSSSSGLLSAQERTGKIRTTLQEYGFKVPEIKITASRSKKLRSKKSYKLLLLSTAEKQQIISDKYSQVLFQNLDNSKVADTVSQSDISEVHLYNIATGITYECLKSNTIFYIEELIEKSQTTVGCLLRDWSEIPGRPVSPICDPCGVNFSDIECSQDELDIILSGPLKHAQDIVKNKHSLLLQEDCKSQYTNILKDLQKECDNGTNMDVNTVENLHDTTETTDLRVVEPLTAHKLRSYSPDIFEDEMSCLMDNSRRDNVISQEVSTISTIKENNDFMDLTECVNVKSQRILILDNTRISEKPISQLSQGSNTTKRKSNDFMEITGCVAGILQPVITIVDYNIDLTQNSDRDDSAVTLAEEINKNVHSNYIETMDLTQSSNSNDSLPFVQISGRSKSLDDTVINDDANDKSIELEDTIILNDNGEINERYTLFAKENKQAVRRDLVFESQDSKEKILDVSNECVSTLKQDAIKNKLTCLYAIENVDEVENLDLQDKKLLKSKDSDTYIDSKIQEDVISAKSHDNHMTSKTESSFEEFVHHHSDDGNEKHIENVICLDDTVNKSTSDVSKGSDDNKLDLTQTSESTEEIVDIHKSSQIACDTSSLDKKDISIDYDEIFNDIVKSCSLNSKNSSIFKVTKDRSGFVSFALTSKSNSDLINSSQDSEKFENLDKELDYSLNKTNHEIVHKNFDLGGISIMDNLSNARSSKSSNFDYHSSLNDPTNDSFLPMVDLKGSKSEPVKKCDEFTIPKKIHSAEASTPFIKPANKEEASSGTPKNSEYIIKMEQVTPMSNYESMTTPERNRELDKYGLKPFKRKRAIQLLTHLYNQTHPIVASCSNDISSSSKRVKTDNICVSPKKLTRSPKKNLRKSKSPTKILEGAIKSAERNTKEENADEADKGNDLYEVTIEVPDIKNIECHEEDWVFQKREKAKVHSCRVPLHIAFHNYVSTRRCLWEAVLRYEPVNIDVIHKGLVASGYRYDPKDLLKFMDKKCITVKTADSGSKNNMKHY